MENGDSHLPFNQYSRYKGIKGMVCSENVSELAGIHNVESREGREIQVEELRQARYRRTLVAQSWNLHMAGGLWQQRMAQLAIPDWGKLNCREGGGNTATFLG